MKYDEIQTGRVYVLRANDMERVVVVKMKIEKEIRLRHKAGYFPAWQIENGWLDRSNHFFLSEEVQSIRKVDNIICEVNTFKARRHSADTVMVNPSQLTVLPNRNNNG